MGNKFYAKVLTPEGKCKFIPKKGHRIKLVSWLDTFIYRAYSYTKKPVFHLIEMRTGLELSSGISVKEAIDSAKCLIFSDKDFIFQSIEKALKEYGISPNVVL